MRKSWRNSLEDDKSRRTSLLGHGRQSETRDEGTEETDEQPLQMTATAANARLLGCTEGPSDAWRTALALRADAQQSRPSAQRLHSAACQLGLDGAVCRSLAYERLMRRCKVWRALQIVWLDRLVGRGWHAQSPQNDVSCPVRSILPARGAEELWLSSSSSTPLVDVFIFLLWSRRKKCVVGPMTRDTSFGARAPKERLQPGTLKHQPCVMLSERT